MMEIPQAEAGSEHEGTQLEIPAQILEAMVAHCLREAPLECCGILGGVFSRVSSIHPAGRSSGTERVPLLDSGQEPPGM